MVTTVPVEYCPLIGCGLSVKVVGPGCAFATTENRNPKTINKYFFTTVGLGLMVRKSSL
jgi:hypothetical protein